jgi:cytochrome c5
MPVKLPITSAVTLVAAVLLFLCALPATVTADAKSDFESRCTACHGFGIAGAPKLGDIEAWKGRIDKGMDVLYDSAINGINSATGSMPARGGFAALSDEQLIAIVDYMVENSR